LHQKVNDTFPDTEEARNGGHEMATQDGAKDPTAMNKVDDLAESLDELSVTLDEIKDEPDDIDEGQLDKVKSALDQATDAVDDIENEQ
jgi:hypothetical protein